MRSVRAVMREVLRRAPGSIRELADEAGLSDAALRQAAAGQINLRPETARKVVEALRRWGRTCDALADKLEKAINEEEERR